MSRVLHHILHTTALVSGDPTIRVPDEVFLYEDGAVLACHYTDDVVYPAFTAYPSILALELAYRIDTSEVRQ